MCDFEWTVLQPSVKQNIKQLDVIVKVLNNVQTSVLLPRLLECLSRSILTTSSSGIRDKEEEEIEEKEEETDEEK